MRNFRSLLLLCLIVASAGAVGAQTQDISITKALETLPDLSGALNKTTATITGDAAGAESIMKNLLTTEDLVALDNRADQSQFEDRDFYCIIHILRWSNLLGNTQTVQAENWYLYNQHKLTLAKPDQIPRLYGAKNITLLYIHLNRQRPYEPLYQIEVKKRTPAYISHLLGVAELFRSPGSAPASLLIAAANYDSYAADSFTLKYKVSDITMTPKVVQPAGTIEEAGVAHKFDNEGKYRVDFSVGVPVRRLSQLEFDATNNTVTPKEVDKTDILALVNVYAVPIDIRNNNSGWVPHFVGGVAIAKQPLHRIFVGGGFGPVVANFYVGALFVKQEELSILKPGDPATPDQLSNDLRRRYKTKVAFGLNVPIGAIVEKLKR